MSLNFCLSLVYSCGEFCYGTWTLDAEDISYITALVRESLRSVLPFPRYLATTVVMLTIYRYYTPSTLALPRLTLQPFEYEGKVIPEGTSHIEYVCVQHG